MLYTGSIPIWIQAPFIRIIIPFCIGLVLAWYLPIHKDRLIITSIVVIGVLPLFSLLSLQTKYYYGYLQGLLVNLLVLLAGAGLMFNYKAPNDPNWIGTHKTDHSYLLATVTESPIKKTNSYKLVVHTDAFIAEDSLHHTSGLTLLYIQPDSNAASLTIGDVILLRSTLQLINSSGNPGGFDYRKFLSYSNIYYQSYVQKNAWWRIGSNSSISISRILLPIKKKILTTIQQNIPNKKEQGLAEALLIGYMADLDRELIQAYSNTGVVHVIAISGLHLGLVYWMLNLIFYPFRNKKKAKLPVSILVLSGLWVFSFLSGASPSVLRSAVMFSFIIIGHCGAKKISIYNSLAASAFFLLCVNPCWLWDIGFQLSYMAVLSIVLFMKPIYHLIFVRNKILDLLWQLTSVTIAAQILTTPLSVYHFHQFPILFLFTNLIAVPLSSLILFGEVLLVLFASLNSFSALIGKLIQWLIRLMNDYVEYMNEFPYSIWTGLQTNLAQTFILYLIIIFFISYSRKRSITKLYMALFCLMGFFTWRTISFVKASRQHLIIVYNVPKKQAIDIGIGQSVAFIGEDSILLKPTLQRQYLYPTRTLFRLNHEFQLQSTEFISIESKKILIVDQQLSTEFEEKPLSVDLVILSNNPRFNLADLQSRVVFRQLILDASNNGHISRSWKADCKNKNIPCHAVSVDGAFVMK